MTASEKKAIGCTRQSRNKLWEVLPVSYILTSQWLDQYVYRTKLDASPFAYAGVGTLLITAVVPVLQTLKIARTNTSRSLKEE